MKLFDITRQKNLFAYLILPHFIKAHFFTSEDKQTLNELNQSWNLEINQAVLAKSYDSRHGYDSGEGSSYPLTELLNFFFINSKCLGDVLEVGAGSGFVTGKLASKSRSWTALELVPDLAKQIESIKQQRNLKQVSVINKSFQEANLSNEQFDTIILFHTLHHLTERRDVIYKLYNYLKPGGVLYCLEPRHNLQRILQLTKKYLLIYRRGSNHRAFVTHDFISRIELNLLLKQAGFHKVKLFAFDFPCIQRLSKGNRAKQFVFESNIHSLPIVEHFGRFLFSIAAKSTAALL